MIFLAFDFKIRYNLMRGNFFIRAIRQIQFKIVFSPAIVLQDQFLVSTKCFENIKIYNEIFSCIFFSPDPFFSFRLDLNLSVDLTNHVFDCWNWKYLGCDESSSTYFELHTEAIKKEKVFFGVKKILKHTLTFSLLIFCIFFPIHLKYYNILITIMTSKIEL